MNRILNGGRLSVLRVRKSHKFRTHGISVELPVIGDTLDNTHVMYLTGERYLRNFMCA